MVEHYGAKGGDNDGCVAGKPRTPLPQHTLDTPLPAAMAGMLAGENVPMGSADVSFEAAEISEQTEKDTDRKNPAEMN